MVLKPDVDQASVKRLVAVMQRYDACMIVGPGNATLWVCTSEYNQLGDKYFAILTEGNTPWVNPTSQWSGWDKTR